MRTKKVSVLWLGLTLSLILLASLSATAQEKLLLHYPFNEGQGFDVMDVSGNENHGTVINIDESAWIKGKEFRFGGCLELDGLNDHVKSIVPFSQALDGDFTASIWFTAASGTRFRLFTFSRGGEKMINVRSTDDIIRLDDSGGVAEEPRGTIIIADRQWHHVALVRSGSELILFLDGNQHLTAPLDRVELLDNITIAARAQSDGSLDDYLPGKLDEVSIYAEALDIDQIRFIMEHPSLPG
jgi:sialidase-1